METVGTGWNWNGEVLAKKVMNLSYLTAFSYTNFDVAVLLLL